MRNGDCPGGAVRDFGVCFEAEKMKASKCFTGNRKGHQTPTMNKAAYFQLIKMCREANKKEAKENASKNADG